MRTILAGLTILALAACALAAGGATAPTAPAYGVNYWELDTAVTSANYDTVNGSGDSSQLRINWVADPGYDYVLYCAAATDAGTGAPEFILTLRAKDMAGTIIKTYSLVDTLTAADGGAYFTLPIGRTGFAYKWDVLFDAGAANGAANHTVNQWGIYKRRTIYPSAPPVGGRR